MYLWFNTQPETGKLRVFSNLQTTFLLPANKNSGDQQSYLSSRKAMSQAFCDTLDPVSKGIWCPKGFWPRSKVPHLIHPQTQCLTHLYAIKLSFHHLINIINVGGGTWETKLPWGNGIQGCLFCGVFLLQAAVIEITKEMFLANCRLLNSLLKCCRTNHICQCHTAPDWRHGNSFAVGHSPAEPGEVHSKGIHTVITLEWVLYWGPYT